MNKRRIMCTVKYDGSDFFGFQRQNKGRTVQHELERALKKIAKTTIVIHGAGRTDSGVHANGQVFHFDTILTMEAHRFKAALNSMLPPDVFVTSSKEIDLELHSRFHAISKEYHYLLSTNEYDPLRSKYVHFSRRQLNVKKMAEAINYFVGTHDFTSYTANMDEINKVRTIFHASIECKEGEYVFKFIGNGFMKYMIRTMMGTLIQVGNGKRQPIEILEILDKKDRTFAGPTAKPEGLYLQAVHYTL